ncbi:beta-adaptin [Sorochytrium milnesiophthora]
MATSVLSNLSRHKIEAAMNALPPKVQKFFNNIQIRKGENFELKTELNSEYKERRKEAVKRVIQNMTVGKDVSSLFADVLKCMQTDDLELKKLVYLYLINYARSQPELVILAVNSFVKDVDDPNPLIRALAVRTMGCLRSERIVDYLCDPLRKTLKDSDPYVRKTAALCVAKLYDLAPTLTIENGFVVSLQDMLGDANPMVVSNSVAALVEIRASAAKRDVFSVSAQILHKLLAALNECTEWGQITILECLADYKPIDPMEAQNILERVLPRLQHANASVVLSAIRVLMIYMTYLQNDDLLKQTIKKLSPPLGLYLFAALTQFGSQSLTPFSAVTLLASSSEVTYVALRNINLILQKRPEVLSTEMRVFFCKYNDPPYVKMEKLDIIMKLCSPSNVDQVLNELREYANEVDVEFVRKSIRSIGFAAVKIEAAAERCINVLLELIKTKVSYVVQEAIVVIKDIFRKYPNKYEGIIPILCENLDALDEPEAKAALIWIIGQYAERINNAKELIESFMENFKYENTQVQLQLISATVKCFLKRPNECQELVQRVLQTATTGCENPDIRDRAYIYWRLLSTDPQVAKSVVLSEKPPIQADTVTTSSGYLNELVQNISTLASVYHKPASTFIVGGAGAGKATRKGEEEDEEPDAAEPRINASDIPNLLDLDFGTPAGSPQQQAISTSPAPAAPASGGMNLLDLLGDDMPSFGASSSSGPGAVSPTMGGIGLMDMSSSFGAQSTSPIGVQFAAYSAPKTQLLDPTQGKGFGISGTFAKRNGTVFLDMTFQNQTGQPLSDFAVQLNKNIVGFTPSAPLIVPPITIGGVADTSLPLAVSADMAGPMQPPNLLQIAIKNSLDVFYFAAQIPFHMLLDGQANGAAAFQQVWTSGASQQSQFEVQAANGEAALQGKLTANGFIPLQNGQFVAKLLGNSTVLVGGEVSRRPTGATQVTLKATAPEWLPIAQSSLEAIIRS